MSANYRFVCQVARSLYTETDEVSLAGSGQHAIARRFVLPTGLDIAWLRQMEMDLRRAQTADIDGFTRILQINRQSAYCEVVYELVGDTDLKTLLREQRPPVSEIARIGAQIAEILGRLEGYGLHHGALRSTKVRLVGQEVMLTGLGLDAVVEEVRRLGMIIGAKRFLRPIHPPRSDAALLGELLKTMLLDVPGDPASWSLRSEIEALADDALAEERPAAERLQALAQGLSSLGGFRPPPVAVLAPPAKGPQRRPTLPAPPAAPVAPVPALPITVPPLSAPMIPQPIASRGRDIAHLIGVDAPDPPVMPRRPTEAISPDQLRAAAALAAPSPVPLPRAESELRTFGFDLSSLDVPLKSLRKEVTDTISVEIGADQLGVEDTPLSPSDALPARPPRSSAETPPAGLAVTVDELMVSRFSPRAWIAMFALLLLLVGLPLGWVLGNKWRERPQRIVVGLDPPRPIVSATSSAGATPTPTGVMVVPGPGALGAAPPPGPELSQAPAKAPEPTRGPEPTRTPAPPRSPEATHRPPPPQRPSPSPSASARVQAKLRSQLEQLGLGPRDLAALDSSRAVEQCYSAPGACRPEEIEAVFSRAQRDAGLARLRANRLLSTLKQRSSELPIDRIARLEHAYFDLRGLIDKFPQASERFWREAQDFDRDLREPR